MAARNTKHPRKAYRPQGVHVNAVQRAIGGAQRLSRDDVARQVHIVRNALAQFACGQHCAQHWASLADTANVTESLAAIGIGAGADAQRVINQAQQALHDVHQRHRRTGSWTLYAAELDALQWLSTRHHTQLAACSYSEFERAMHATHQRLSQARAGNAPAGAIVVQGEIA